MKKLALLALFSISSLSLLAEGYDVEVVGLEDRSVKKAFISDSQTYGCKEKSLPPLSVLKRRAEHDVEKLTEIAKYYGYYGVKTSYTIQHSEVPKVLFRVDLGPKYILESFSIVAKDSSFDIKQIDQEPLQLIAGKPVTTQAIIDAEKSLLWQLKKVGYATAKLHHLECIANAGSHTLNVTFYVELGPIVRFGETRILGNKSVLATTIEKDVLWKSGTTYDPNAVEKTQERLDATGLFSTVLISEEFEDIDGQKVPMTIHVQESKHHSIGAGVAYATSFGPGVKAEWEDRNLRGMGEKLSFRTEIWKKYRQAVLSLTKPHFRSQNQDLIWVAEYDKLNNIAFHSDSYNLSSIIQRRQGSQIELLYGLRYQWLDSHNFEGHHLYHLIKVPLQFKWSNANNLLDPTKGETVNIRLTPTSHIIKPAFVYALHTTTLAAYRSSPNNRITIAAKAVIGNIVGAARHTIPPPDRFYGGSENVLRGFRAFTVSPLHHKHTPIGGRSLLAGTLEARLRSSGALGWAFFYDVGNVYGTNIPQIKKHQFHSVGTGLRYMTPIGPLRFDIAVPLNPRHNIDPRFQIYFSIGQAF